MNLPATWCSSRRTAWNKGSFPRKRRPLWTLSWSFHDHFSPFWGKCIFLTIRCRTSCLSYPLGWCIDWDGLESPLSDLIICTSTRATTPSGSRSFAEPTEISYAFGGCARLPDCGTSGGPTWIKCRLSWHALKPSEGYYTASTSHQTSHPLSTLLSKFTPHWVLSVSTALRYRQQTCLLNLTLPWPQILQRDMRLRPYRKSTGWYHGHRNLWRGKEIWVWKGCGCWLSTSAERLAFQSPPKDYGCQRLLHRFPDADRTICWFFCVIQAK